ncbi:MAG TPA: baseplate J/gp47 family protein, partial [Myxococcus sp.]|nr:baseplate J/gp47 family protein [Myxococcus sp.]
SDVRAWVCRAAVPLFGHDAPAWEGLPLKRALRYGTAVGGLLRLDSPQAGAWQGLWAPPQPVLCLLAGEEGLFAGVESQGVQRSRDGGRTWTGAKGPLARADVLCLGRDTQGRLLAGTRAQGVFRSADGGDSWELLRGRVVSEQEANALGRGAPRDLRMPGTPVRCVAGFLAGEGDATAAYLLAGTDDGLFCWEESTGVWRPVNEGLPLSKGGGSTPVSIRALWVDESGRRFVLGTSHGVFITKRIGDRWTARTPPGDRAVSALLVDAQGALLVALEEGGLYRSTDEGKRYTPTGPVTPPGAAVIQALLPLAPDTTGPAGVLAATAAGLFVSRNGGATWTPLPAPTPLDVRALAEPAPGQLLAATPVTGVVETTWPGWTLESGRLDLARPAPRITEGGLLLLEQDEPDGTARRALVTVKGALTQQFSGFELRQLVTRVQVEPAEAVSGFDRARAVVRPCGAPLPLLEQQIRAPELLPPGADVDTLLADASLFEGLVREPHPADAPPREDVVVDGAVSDPTGRTVIVQGRRMRAWVGLHARLPPLVSDDTRAQEPLQPGQVLEVLEWPQDDEGSAQRWRLRTEHGFIGTTRATAGQLTLLPAAPDGEQVAVRRRVTGCAPLPGATRLVVDTPLRELLDPDTVTVRGNVVEATHGATVTEVLGSGDARRAHQRFRLKRAPLAWLATPEGPAPALEVWVQEQRWRRVDDWYGQKADSRVYVLRVESDGTAWACFGDGVLGARLPTGQENVKAVYRMGGGPDGNVASGRIVLPRQRPLGLRAVDNPLPASGGTAAEPSSALRSRTPLQVRTLGRIVSLRDFEDQVRAWPGVAHVRARRLWNGQAPVLSLTVASTEEDTQHRMGASLEAALRQELERFRPPSLRVQLDSYVPRPFVLAAVLTVAPDFDGEAVEASARQVLLESFRFEHRHLAQPVATSDLLRLLSGVRGVVNARVTALRPGDVPPSPVPSVLTAADSRWDPGTGRVLPAEMLLLDPAGLTLTLEQGP